jgi:hypothetical protein
MRTSRTFTKLPDPTVSDAKISKGTLAYVNARNRQREYDVVIREFQNSGISQSTLACRLGKPPEVVCRWLSRPHNWEADTFSSLLFAISGAVPVYSVSYPLRMATSVSLSAETEWFHISPSEAFALKVDNRSPYTALKQTLVESANSIQIWRAA